MLSFFNLVSELAAPLHIGLRATQKLDDLETIARLEFLQLMGDVGLPGGGCGGKQRGGKSGLRAGGVEAIIGGKTPGSTAKKQRYI